MQRLLCICILALLFGMTGASLEIAGKIPMWSGLAGACLLTLILNVVWPMGCPRKRS